jgi:hypothetical protein
MKFLRFLLTAIVVALLLGAGAWLVRNSISSADWNLAWDRIGSWMVGHRLSGFGFGISFFLLVMAWGLAAVSAGRQPSALTLATEGGEIRVSLRAVSDFVSRLGAEFKEVVSLRPVITTPRGHLRIDIGARLRSGAQVPDLCRRIQDRVREAVQANLGVEKIDRVRVFVRDIAGPVPADGSPVRGRTSKTAAAMVPILRDRPRDDYAMLDAPALSQLDRPEKKS